MKNLKRHEVIMILIVASAYNSIYGIAFMKALYYVLMQNGLGLTHFELGKLYSVYGIFSMFSYLCGAFFLNRYKCWKLIAFSSLTIGILTISLTLLPSFNIMLIIFGMIGFLLGAAFYPAHLQILHQIGGTSKQGAVFSLFYVFNGILGVIFSTTGLGITSIPASDAQLVRFLFFFFAFLNLIVAFLAAVFLRKLPEDDAEKAPLSLKSVKELMKMKKLWDVILIVFTNYIAFASLNYILPFLSDKFSLSATFTSIFAIFRVYLFGIFVSPLAGRITDRLRSASKLLSFSFVGTAACLAVMLIFFQGNVVGTVCFLVLTCLFVIMGKSMAVITIDEARIPATLYGMSISFISFCAYSPDAFYYSISGFLLDTFPEHGYNIIFIITIITCMVGFYATYRLRREK